MKKGSGATKISLINAGDLWLTVMAIYFYLSMEWLFFVTKPSFLNLAPFWVSLSVLFLATVFPVSLVFIFYGLLRLARIRTAAVCFCRLVTVGVALSTAIVMIDNFTLTLLGFGIKDTDAFTKIPYLVGSLLFIVAIWKRISKFKLPAWSRKLSTALVIASLVLFYPVMIKGYFQHTGDEIMKMRGRDDNKKFPNIIFFASDGVEAAHLKTYGYHRDTVPNLNSLSDRFLLFENAFPNSGKTIISTTSLLTGKDPLATKVFSPSHLLEGKDAYEHLPGILKLQGYKTLQETVSYYADSSEINMRNAFDEANGVKISNTFTLKYFPGFLQSFGYEEKFLKKALGRAGERYLHLLGIRDIKDIYAQLVNEKGAKLKDFWKKGDDERINRAIRFMKQSSSPFFLHIHLMSDTHCRTFKDVCELAPAIKEYSKSRDATLDDQYDDAIKMSDRNFGRLINWLKANKKLDNTVIVYTSDHGRLWNSRTRVPLIFIFPDMKGPKTRLENVSLLDVAPTILDYIGLEIPSFMDGRSLLAEKLAEKPIFTVPDFNALDRMTIPRIQMIMGDYWYELENKTSELSMGFLAKRKSSCEIKDVISGETAVTMIKSYMSQRIIPKD